MQDFLYLVPAPIPEPKVEDIPISSEFLVQSEQKKMNDKKRRKKHKNLWKDHTKVLKQIDDEQKKLIDKAKLKTLMLAEETL